MMVSWEGKRRRKIIANFKEECFLEPLGRPLVIIIFAQVSVRPSVRPHFSKFGKTKQTAHENNDRYWRDCGSGRGDPWWHMSCSYFFFTAAKKEVEAKGLPSTQHSWSNLVAFFEIQERKKALEQSMPIFPFFCPGHFWKKISPLYYWYLLLKKKMPILCKSASKLFCKASLLKRNKECKIVFQRKYQ